MPVLNATSNPSRASTNAYAPPAMRSSSTPSNQHNPPESPLHVKWSKDESFGK